jgi:hypothetical protein
MTAAGVEHFQIGGAKNDVIVEPDTIANRAVQIKHGPVAECIPQSVQTVHEQNTALVPPLKSINGCSNGISVIQHSVFSMWGKKRKALGAWEPFGDLGFGVGQAKQPQKRHPSFSKFHGQVNHVVRIWRIKQVNASRLKEEGTFIHGQSSSAPVFRIHGQVFNVLETLSTSP